MVHRELEAGLPSGRTQPLTLQHFARCIKWPWEKSFAEKLVLLAWQKDGLFPFDRRCYWAGPHTRPLEQLNLSCCCYCDTTSRPTSNGFCHGHKS